MYSESVSHQHSTDPRPLALSSRASELGNGEKPTSVCSSSLILTGPHENFASSPELSPPTMQTMFYAVSALLNAVNCALANEGEHARQYLCDAFRSLDHAPFVIDAKRVDADHAPVDHRRSGLAPWQIRKVSTHVEEHMSEPIQCDELALLVRLSVSHFMRAFRDSFGFPPHTYVMKRRIERAQGMMLTTKMPLGHIALECGLADQSHLCRLFQKFVGESPAAWRRARDCGSLSASAGCHTTS